MDKLIDLLPNLGVAAVETLYIVVLAVLIGGFFGLVLGIVLYATRPGGLFPNRPVSIVTNLVINFFRPIPFIIFLAAFLPISRLIVGTGIGNTPVIFSLALAASFAIGRIAEQNLLTVDPGVVEAARSIGASRLRTLFSIVLPEALAPLILGYTFIFVAVVDMSAIAGYIGGGGLGAFALSYGYRQNSPWVTWAAVVIIVIFVQIVQSLGNLSARRIRER